MGAIAVIPARGGSKRLPRKNIVPLLGKPLVRWVIDAAMASRHIDVVCVSTEDEEIARIAQMSGALVVDRPAELAGDLVWTEPVIQHAVEAVEAQRQTTFPLVVWLNVTIPQVTSDDIDAAITRLEAESLREVISVDRHMRCTSAVRVLRREALFQHRLSVVCGVMPLDYVEVHTREDLELAERAMQASRGNT
jgi:CMP-N-acetylneuraminic acid synthetase